MPIVKLDYTNSLIEDTYVRNNGGENGNYSTAVTLNVGVEGVTKYETLLKFNMGMIPNGVIINSAILTMVVANGSSITVQPRLITTDFDVAKVTYNTKPVVDNIAYPSSTTTEIELKEIIQKILNGEGYGVFLESVNFLRTFHSFNSSSTGYRPTLIIDYSIPTEDKKQVEYVGYSESSSADTKTLLNVKYPVGIVQGDMLVAYVTSLSDSKRIAPEGWSILSDEAFVPSFSVNLAIMYKRYDGVRNEDDFTFSARSPITLSIQAFRNVKGIREVSSMYGKSGNSQINAITNLPKNVLLLFFAGLTSVSNTIYVNSGLSINTYYTNALIHKYLIAGTYNHSKTSYDPADVSFTVNSISNFGVKPFYLEPTTNEPPKIDGLDEYLGVHDAPLKKQYTVTDTEGDAVVITEKVNGVTLATKNVVGTHTLDLTSVWKSLPLGKHSVTVSASDDYDPTRITVRTWTFLKTLPENAKTPEVVSGVGDLVAIFEGVKDMFANTISGLGGTLPPEPLWTDIDEGIENTVTDAVLKVTPGTNLFYTMPAYLMFGDSVNYVELATFKIKFSGTVRISYTGSNLSARGFTRIYVNHQPVGVEFSNNVVGTEDISVSFGDELSFYGRTIIATGATPCQLRDIKFQNNILDFNSIVAKIK